LLDRVLSTGEPFTARDWRIIVAGHPDGDERFVSFWLVPLSGPDGRRCGVGCQFVDVTAQVRRRRSAEDDAETVRRRYAAAQDVVLTLQRSLLPAGLPVLPGVRTAAHYLPGIRRRWCSRSTGRPGICRPRAAARSAWPGRRRGSARPRWPPMSCC